MWGRKRPAADNAKPEEQRPQRLKDALRKARVESADRTGIVVDLRDAEVARLELLHEALEPLFVEVPPEVDLFDLGISRGEAPKLWIDAIAHIAMGRDKRVYRFVQDTRYGRKVLAESLNVGEIVQAVTKYLAQRLVERERALVDFGTSPAGEFRRAEAFVRGRRRRAIGIFLAWRPARRSRLRLRCLPLPDLSNQFHQTNSSKRSGPDRGYRSGPSIMSIELPVCSDAASQENIDTLVRAEKAINSDKYLS